MTDHSRLSTDLAPSTRLERAVDAAEARIDRLPRFLAAAVYLTFWTALWWCVFELGLWLKDELL